MPAERDKRAVSPVSVHESSCERVRVPRCRGRGSLLSRGEEASDATGGPLPLELPDGRLISVLAGRAHLRRRSRCPRISFRVADSPSTPSRFSPACSRSPRLWCSCTCPPPASGPRGAVPWYDLAAAIAGFAASSFLAIRYASISELTSKQPWDGLLAGRRLLVLFPPRAGPHVRIAPLLYHPCVHRARDVRGKPCPGNFARARYRCRAWLLPGVGFERDSRHRDQDHRNRRRGIRFFRPVLLKAGGSTSSPTSRWR